MRATEILSGETARRCYHNGDRVIQRHEMTLSEFELVPTGYGCCSLFSPEGLKNDEFVQREIVDPLRVVYGDDLWGDEVVGIRGAE